MIRVLATATAELTEGKSLSRRLFVFCGGVIAALAITTLKHNVVPRHNVTSLLIPVGRSLLFYFFRDLVFLPRSSLSSEIVFLLRSRFSSEISNFKFQI